MAVININEQIVERAVSEFVPKADYLQSTYLYTPTRPVTKGSVVVVPFVTSSVATAFVAGTGYTTNNTDLGGTAVTLNQDYYSLVNIDDPSYDVMGDDTIVEAINNAAARVLRQIATGSIATVTVGNFATVSAYATATFGTSGSAAMGDIEGKTVDWMGNKYIIANATLLAALHTPNTVNRSSTFEYIKNALSGYVIVPTSIVLPSASDGLVVAKQHLAVVSGLKVPPANSTTMYKAFPVNGMPGLVMGFRRFYNDVTGTVQTVIEATWGVTKLDTSAAIHIT